MQNISRQYLQITTIIHLIRHSYIPLNLYIQYHAQGKVYVKKINDNKHVMEVIKYVILCSVLKKLSV